MIETPIYERPSEILQQLIRFNTTNLPGNEAACIRYISNLLQEADIETTIVAKDDNRPNLIARISGNGNAPPLLLQGHVDVVTTADQEWDHDPFAGEIIDGYVWGRGALDMKGGVAMMLAAFMRAHAEQTELPGDVIFAALSDEEAGSRYGAGFLVEEHPDLFADVRYAIGEFGAFSIQVAGQRFYPIMVAEKQTCSLKLTISGPGGHGSIPIQGGAMAKLATVLHTLDQNQLPVHVTPVARQMVEGIATAVSFPANITLRQLLNPALTNMVLKVMGEQGRTFSPLFHNTVSPTIVRGGEKINVIPSEIVVDLDGRLLPGFSADDMLRELHDLLGHDLQIEVTRFEPGPPQPNMSQFDMLADIMREADPQGQPIPLLLTAVTDARHFAQLGIQTYGFLPLQLPEGFRFNETIHAANERVPVAAITFGTNAIFQALQRFTA